MIAFLRQVWYALCEVMLVRLQTLETRRYDFDNLRGLLILCVVFAHLVEIFTPFPSSESLYRIIYSFHMPAFLFLFGYFATFRPGRIGWQVLMYLLFQSMYLLFARYALGSRAAWQYTTPYWLLWYLLVCIYYQLLTPVYNLHGKPLQAGMFVLTVLLALVAGFMPSIGYKGSFSRFFVFQPFFVAGFYFRKYEQPIRKLFAKGRLWWRLAGCLLPVIAGICLLRSDISRNMLYGSYAYAKTHSTLWSRLGILLMGCGWIIFLVGSLGSILKRKVPLLTALGQNTLPVFLLHGFVVRALPQVFPKWMDKPILILPITMGILFPLGNPWVGKAFRYIFDPPFLKQKHTA